MPSIWILELDRLNKALDCLCNLNNTSNATEDTIFGLQLQELVGYKNYSHVTYNDSGIKAEVTQPTTLTSLLTGLEVNTTLNSTTEGYMFNNITERLEYTSEQTTFIPYTTWTDDVATMHHNLTSTNPRITQAPDIVSKVCSLTLV